MTLKALLLFAVGATAHFGLTFPEWRADTLNADEESGYDQRVYPCKSHPACLPSPIRTTFLPLTRVPGANVPGDEGPTTDWPLNGGSLTLDLHHDWTYLFLNLGLGTNVTNFNVSISHTPWNATGSGTLCIPRLPLDLGDVEDGTEASLQVVTVGHDGASLYNCANLRLVAEAEEFGGEECATEGVEYYIIGEVEDPVTSDGEVPEASVQKGDGGEEGHGEEGEDEEGADEEGRGFVSRAPAMLVLGLALTSAVGLLL